MPVKSRLAILRKIFSRPIVIGLMAVWTVIGVYDQVVSQILPADIAQSMPRFSSVITDWLSWELWLAILFGFLAVVAIEYAYRRSTHSASSDQTDSSFDIQLSNDVFTLGDYECICAITIRNIEQNELTTCLVQIESLSSKRPNGMPMPLVLRTEGQIRGGRSGRFNLSSRQIKTIPVLFRNPRRKNEWFFFDENKNSYFDPAHETKITLGIHGGKFNSEACIEIKVERDFNVDATISIGIAKELETSSRAPERISLVELCKTAMNNGWDLLGHDSLQILDLMDGIRQAGLDGTFKVWGRLTGSFEELTRREPLKEIPRDHWEQHEIYPLSCVDGIHSRFVDDNFKTYTYLKNELLPFFVDIHLENATALNWLKNESRVYIGRNRIQQNNTT